MCGIDCPKPSSDTTNVSYTIIKEQIVLLVKCVKAQIV